MNGARTTRKSNVTAFHLYWLRLRRPQSRPAEHGAPSWSWASAEGVIYHLQMDYRKEAGFMAESSNVHVENRIRATQARPGRSTQPLQRSSKSPRKLTSPLREILISKKWFEGSYKLFDGEKSAWHLSTQIFPLTNLHSYQIFKLTVFQSSYLGLDRPGQNFHSKRLFAGLVLALRTTAVKYVMTV